MKKFVLLSAIPGSGKSTWARKYQSTHENTYIVSSDQIRLTHFGAVNNFDHEKEVWEIFLQMIHEYGKIENVTVICDSTNLTNYFRAYYAGEAKEFDKKILVYFDLPFDICMAQNVQRTGASVVPDSAMQRMWGQFEKPSEEILALYDECVTVRPHFEKAEI